MKFNVSNGKISMVLLSVFITACTPAAAQPIELTLAESVLLTLKNNPTMQIVQARKEETAWGIKEAQSNQDVAVDYRHTERRSTAPPSWVPSLAAVAPYNYFNNQLTASVPLYTGGKIASYIEQAQLSHNLSGLEVAVVKQQLQLETRVEYYRVLQNQTLLDIAKQTVTDFDGHLRRVQHMYETGIVPWHDVLQTKVKLANAENNLVKSQKDYDLAVHRLNKSMGLSLQSDIKLTEPLVFQPYVVSMDNEIAYGLEHRPELKQSSESIKLEQAQVRIAQSDGKPQVMLSGTMSWTDTRFAGTKNKDWTAMLVTQWRVFDAGHTAAKVQQAQKRELGTREKARQTKDDVTLEISDAYFSLKEAEKRIGVSKLAVEEADNNFDIAQKAYSAGVGTNLDVMDAELARNQAKTNYTNAIFDYSISRSQLDRAVGREF